MMRIRIWNRMNHQVIKGICTYEPTTQSRTQARQPTYIYRNSKAKPIPRSLTPTFDSRRRRLRTRAAAPKKASSDSVHSETCRGGARRRHRTEWGLAKRRLPRSRGGSRPIGRLGCGTLLLRKGLGGEHVRIVGFA